MRPTFLFLILCWHVWMMSYQRVQAIRVLQTPRVGGSLWFDARGGKELHFLSSLDSSSRFRLLPNLGRVIQVVNVLNNVQPELQAAMQKFRQKIDHLDSTLVDKCDAQPCKNFGFCVHDPRMTYHCSCQTGRTGAHCEDDVNECASPAPPCAGNSYCVNTEGSYSCTCMQGWQGESCLDDVDECLEGHAACNSTHSRCENLAGTYVCVCPEGHHGPNCEPIPTTTAETTLRPTTTMLPPTTNALTSVGNSGTTMGKSGGTTAGQTTSISGRQNPLCGQTTFLAGSGFVTSPNYPEHYPNNIECTYHIAATPGMLVFIRFIDEFGLESDMNSACTYDYITVVVNGTSTLGTYCGTQGPPSGITGVTVDVTLKTDFAIRRKGFRLRYEAISEESMLTTIPEMPDTCGTSTTTVSGVKGTLTSPKFPENYPSDLSCLWTFLAPHDKYVEVRFETFFVETNSKCNYDRVLVFTDGVETSSGPYCTANPPSETFYGKNVTVKFISDSSVSEQGFEMTYQGVDGVASLRKMLTLTDPLPCGETSFSNTGILESPNYPEKYSNGLHCAWNIRVAKGRTVKLWFETFDVEAETYCQYDRVVVETHPGHYHQLCNSKQISPLESLTNQMKVTFITDTALAANGFRAFWIAQHEYTEKRLSREVNVEEGKTGYLDCGDSNTLMGDPVVLTFGSPRYNWSHEGKPLAVAGTVLSVRGAQGSTGRYLCVTTSNMTDEVLMQTFNVHIREAAWFGSGEGSASGEGLGSGTDLSDQPAGVLSETADLTSTKTVRLWDGDSEISSSPGSGEGGDGVEGGVTPTAVVTTGREGAMGEGFESHGSGQQVQGVRDVMFGTENENEEVLVPTTEGAMGQGFESHGNGDQGSSFVWQKMFGGENENETPPSQPEPGNPPANNVDLVTVEDTHSDNDNDVHDNDIDAPTTQSNTHGDGHDTTLVMTETTYEQSTNRHAQPDTTRDTPQEPAYADETDTYHMSEFERVRTSMLGQGVFTNEAIREIPTTHEDEQPTNHHDQQDTTHDTHHDTTHDTPQVSPDDTDDTFPMSESQPVRTSMLDRDVFTNEAIGEAPEMHPMLTVHSFVREINHLRDSGELSPVSLFHALGMTDRSLPIEHVGASLNSIGNPSAAGLLQALGIRNDPFLAKSMEAFFGEMHRKQAAGNHTVASLLQSLGMGPDFLRLTQPERPEQGVESEGDPMANLTRLLSEVDPSTQVGEGGGALNSFAKAFADIMEISEGWGKRK